MCSHYFVTFYYVTYILARILIVIFDGTYASMGPIARSVVNRKVVCEF